MSRPCVLRSCHTHFSVQHAALGQERRGAWSQPGLSPRKPGGGVGVAGLGEGGPGSWAQGLVPRSPAAPEHPPAASGRRRAVETSPSPWTETRDAGVETNSSGAV